MFHASLHASLFASLHAFCPSFTAIRIASAFPPSIYALHLCGNRSTTIKNMQQSRRTGFAHPFACSLAPLNHSLAPHYSFRSQAPLRSFVRSLAHSLLSCRKVNDQMYQNEQVSSHSARSQPAAHAFDMVVRCQRLRLNPVLAS